MKLILYNIGETIIGSWWIMKDVSFRDCYPTLSMNTHIFEEEALWEL
jgi:hypothetical protein